MLKRIAITGTCALGLAVGTMTTTPAIANESSTNAESIVVTQSTPPGFVQVKAKQRRSILRKMEWQSTPVSQSPRCWEIYKTQSNKRWATMRMAFKSGCPVGEGWIAIKKSGRKWVPLPIGGTSLPCNYLADELRARGARADVIRDFQRGWNCF